jgi:precorrin-6A/cobalt-precorrin-6A reductase
VVILILGGTAEARSLAAGLGDRQLACVSSLAGRVARPRLPVGEVRVGGFGGVDGLMRWLGEHRATAVIDATHPFAEQISAHATAACVRTGTPLLRLERPGWAERSGWRWVSDLEKAAAAIPAGARVFLTTGRQGLAAFAGVGDAWFLIRCVDPPDSPLPPHHELILSRGPYALADEGELMDSHRIDLLITKDSGGEHTVGKLDAAQARGVPVLIVRRPPHPGVPTVSTVAEALAWAAQRCRSDQLRTTAG